MYNLSQSILNVIYNYLVADINKNKFKLCYPEYNKIILEAEYNIDDAIKYLSLGCYVKLKNYVNYLDPRLDKYKNNIYGCYISSNDELYKLFCCNNNLTHIAFRDDFNKPINKYPNKVTHITFGHSFNKPLDNLPDSVTHLKLGYKFNNPVDKLPSNLKKIDFSIWSLFNKDLNNLPESIKCVIVSKFYNNHVPDTISNKICTYTSAVSRAKYKDYIYNCDKLK